MKRLLTLPVLCATLAATACQRDGTGVDDIDQSPQAANVVSVQLVELPGEAFWWAGDTLTLRFRAEDITGKGIPGVVVQIRRTEGDGSIDSPLAHTDSLGAVAVQWTLGAPGRNAIVASVPGTPHSRMAGLTIRPKSNDRVVLSADTITLAGPTCFTEVSVSGVSKDNFLGFSVDRPDILGGATVNTYTGTVGWMYRGIRARTPGTALVTVADGYGGADTARVRVLDGKTSVAFISDTLRVAVGDSTNVPLRPVGACGPIMHTYASSAILGDTTYSNTYSLDAGVALLRGGRVVGVKAGTTRLATKFYGAVDTAVVVVQ